MQLIAMIFIGILILFIAFASIKNTGKKDKTYEVKDDVIRKLDLRK